MAVSRAKREEAVLRAAKAAGWYLSDRRSFDVGNGDTCLGCGSTDMAWEWYRHVAEREERMFSVCDGCGFSSEYRPQGHSNEEEGRMTFLARHYAGQGCGQCRDFLTDFLATASEETLEMLRYHVRSPLHLDEARAEMIADFASIGEEAPEWLLEDDEDEDDDA